MNPILLTLGDSIDKIFYGFDMWFFNFFGSMQNTFLTYVAKFFTTFGDEAFVIPMVIFGVVLCFFKKTRKYGFALIFAIAVGTIITNVVVPPFLFLPLRRRARRRAISRRGGPFRIRRAAVSAGGTGRAWVRA